MNTNSYQSSKQSYADLGVDTEAALQRLASVPISLHCWQGDDVGGFEKTGSELGGGLAVTGNYPGKARTLDELRGDLEKAFSLIPGTHRLNLHACYADLGGKTVERNEYTVEQFQSWIDWARTHGLGLDFNPTFFAHPLAADGLTLSSADKRRAAILDRARHRLPPHRRGDGPATRQIMRDQRVDSRRQQGSAR